MEVKEKSPDYHLEDFWFTYKCSLENFYKQYVLIQRPLHYWYKTLNLYKSCKQYDKIQKSILNYMTLQLIDTIRMKNKHHMSILRDNIKRYQKTCLLVNFTNLTDEILKLYTIIDIYMNIDIKYDIPFKQVELCVVYNDISFFIEYGIEMNKDSIIDDIVKLNKNNMYEYINNIYNIKLPDKIKGRKIIKLIRKKKNKNN
jgi:hypothetical protein